MTEIRWEAPPENRIDWHPFIEALKSRPGEWAVAREPTSRGSAQSTWKHLTELGCEATVRKVNGEGVGVWARWPNHLCRRPGPHSVA